MKPKKFLAPRGAALKISTELGISKDTIRKCLNGKIKKICSEHTAQLIYAAALKHGAIKIKSR